MLRDISIGETYSTIYNSNAKFKDTDNPKIGVKKTGESVDHGKIQDS
jgi:hypothetical protein